MALSTVETRPGRLTPLVLVLGISLAIAGGSLAFAVWSGMSPRPHAASASGAPSAVDPRLILHARTSSVGGVLEGGVRVDGTLYPALPGPNTLRLTLRRASGVMALVGRIAVVVTMPGMGMPPVAATLSTHGRAYAGVISLPMFGTYQARLVVLAPEGRYTGVIVLTVPLGVTINRSTRHVGP